MMNFDNLATAYVLFGLLRAVRVTRIYIRSAQPDDFPLWLAIPIIATVGAFWGLPLFLAGKFEQIWRAAK